MPIKLIENIVLFQTTQPPKYDPSCDPCAQAKKAPLSPKLTDEQRAAQVDPLLKSGWAMVDGRDAIWKEYKFKGFNEVRAGRYGSGPKVCMVVGDLLG